MSYISSEIVTNILSRLAVNPLLRFRCVCKPWLVLIDNPNFIKLHLNHSIQTNSHRHLILRNLFGHSCIYSLDLDSLQYLRQLNSPLESHEFDTQIVGSSNGLLCLYNSRKGTVLWNPFNQTHHKLPPIELTDPNYPGCSRYSLYGFGYDHLNDDYKVIIIKQSYDSFSSNLFQSQVNVYSFKSNLWQRVSDFPYYLHHNRDYGVFANGALHWVIKFNLIVAFDLGTGDHRLVPQPDWLDADFFIKVCVLEGCLCVINKFDVWVMKEYGVKESWTNLISIAHQNDNRPFSSPIAYSKSGEQVLLENDHGRMISYDFKREELETVTVGGLRHFLNSNVCGESLVKLLSLPSVEKRKKGKQKSKQVPKKRFCIHQV